MAFLNHRVWGAEALRFGVIGVSATATHFLVLTAAVELLGIAAAIANGLAFLVAVMVTYFGQSYWVFRNPSHNLARLQKFISTAVGGMLANVGIMAVTVNILDLPYQLGFVVALLVVPIATFVISKFWVFAGEPPK
ncbi:GtrA family protein [Qingshengfaniella alkalisoli]|nr:GtrA family protein [Qingshengfaniella alkalisoli]